MRINRIIKDSRANGPGVRYTIWVQGCSIHCDGCCNKDTWNPKAGYEMTVDELMEDIRMSPVGDVTFTGGEPLDQYAEVVRLLEKLSPKFAPGVMNHVLSGSPAGRYHVLLTSGYTMAIIKRKFPAVLEHVDILIDGPFIPELRDKGSAWRGSTNQGINFLTEWARKSTKPSASAEIRIGTDGNTVITGFGIPDSLVPPAPPEPEVKSGRCKRQKRERTAEGTVPCMRGAGRPFEGVQQADYEVHRVSPGRNKC